jgi:hypothetical protein
MRRQQPRSAHVAKPTGTLAAFLAMAFLIVGLTGLFTSYAAPLALQRAMAREAALDEAAAAAREPDQAAALAALVPRLGESAAAVAPGLDLAARIDAERHAVRVRFAAESAATLRRLRWLVSIITLMGAAFGVVMLHLAARQPGDGARPRTDSPTG